MKLTTKIKKWFKNLYNKFILFENKTKSQRLIFIVIILWVVFGILGIKYSADLTYLAAYYASLAIFIGSYLWGEHRRSSDATKLLESGPNSVREVTIYITLLLWVIVGIYGVTQAYDISKLTVYFTALSPFINSFIIYETTRKDKDTPILEDEELKQLLKDAVEKAKNV